MTIHRSRRRIARLASAVAVIAVVAVTLAACATGSPDLDQPPTARPDPTVTPAG